MAEKVAIEALTAHQGLLSSPSEVWLFAFSFLVGRGFKFTEAYELADAIEETWDGL